MTDHKTKPRYPESPDWPDKNKLKAFEKKRLAQKNCYTDENRLLIERLINKVQTL